MAGRIVSLLLPLWLFSIPLLAQEQAKQSVTFAYLANGSPVSSMKLDAIEGFCGELHKFLETSDQGFQFNDDRGLPSVRARFTEFAKTLKGSPGIQCGPDSKTRERTSALNDPGGAYTGEFSVPFARTTTKLLINKAAISKVRSLDAPSPGENLRIGVIIAPPLTAEAHTAVGPCIPTASVTPNTIVTTSLIGQVFHNATIIECPNRKTALTALSDGEIDAYAGDEIVLHSLHQEWPTPNQNRDDFVIYPPIYQDGFSQEEYVVTFYNLQGSPLIKLVNDWIKSPKGKAEAARLHPQMSELEQEIKSLLNEDNLAREQARRGHVKKELGDAQSASALLRSELQIVLAERRGLYIALVVLIVALLSCIGYLAMHMGWRFSKGTAPLTDEQFDMAVRLADGLTQTATSDALIAMDEKYKYLKTSPNRVGNEMKKVRKIYGIEGDGLGNLRKYLKRDYPEKFNEYEKSKLADGGKKQNGSSS